MTSEILGFVYKTSIVEELWRRAEVIVAEWEKEPFNYYLDSRVHLDALLAPMGYPFKETEEDVKRYPWIADESRGKIMEDWDDYLSDTYNEDMDQIRDYVWDVVMPDYEKRWQEKERKFAIEQGYESYDDYCKDMVKKEREGKNV